MKGRCNLTVHSVLQLNMETLPLPPPRSTFLTALPSSTNYLLNLPFF